MSLRQQIVDAIEARLRTITIANGYLTNAGQHVYVWKTIPMADGDLPAIVIYDRGESVNQAWSTLEAYCYDLVVDIEAMASGSAADDTIRNVVADIDKACRTDLRWSTLAKHTVIESVEIELTQGEKLTAGAQITLRITY